ARRSRSQLLAVVSHEQLLQGGWLAHDRFHAHPGEDLHDLSEAIGVDFESGPAPGHHEIVDPRNLSERRGVGAERDVERRPRQVPQLVEGARLDGPAVADDAHPVTEGFDLGEDVAGQEHGPAVGRVLLDHLPKSGLHQRVETGGRLVEDEEVHVRGEGGHQRHLLTVPLRIGGSLLGGIQVETLDQIGPALLVEPPAQTTHEVYHLATGEIGPQVHVPRDVRQTAMQFGGVRPGIGSEETGLTGIGSYEPEEDPDRGGLAGPVGAEEPMNLSLRYFEVEPVEGPHMSEGLDQTLDEDVCVHNAPGSVERAFSILIVRSATKQDDLTTRARIRDAALDLFPEQGFNRSTVRVIAEKAGVSPGLVLHHFGSKEGLREACDRYVVTRFRELKDDSLQGGMFDPGFMSRSIG